jgi:crotonobetainyl-CoA:carnitine CoA-transferase CaiB-like acyl-CoA transferase
MKLPLEGVKILDLSLLLPGPLCSLYLADLGAEVIKIENPRAYDATRAMVKSEKGLPGLFYMLNRNKKAITLNLKKEASKEILFKLLESTDVLLEGFRPDALEEMGIGYSVLKNKFPRLIYCGISGYGDSGPYKNFAGHDGNYLALSGVLEQIGNQEEPSPLGIQIADIGGGSLIALSSILAALYSREKTGTGQKIDVSMMESSLQFLSLYAGIYLSTGKLPSRGNELLSGKLANYHIYKTKENRFVFLGALEERFFRAFLRQIGKEEIIQKSEDIETNSESIKRILEEFFANKTVHDLKPIFENTECCLSLIKNLEEVLKDPHLLERKSILKKIDPIYGEYFQFASPFRFSNFELNRFERPPEHGEHNSEILNSLGFSSEKIQEFKLKKII